MPAKPSRFWVVLTLVLLLAAQAHLWLDEGTAPASGHACKYCSHAGLAILSTGHELKLTLRTERLELSLPQGSAKCPLSGESAPRAPPQA